MVDGSPLRFFAAVLLFFSCLVEHRTDRGRLDVLFDKDGVDDVEVRYEGLQARGTDEWGHQGPHDTGGFNCC